MITVMKQALEALDDNQHLIAEHERHVYVMHYNRICEALRKAIEQAEQTGHRDFRVPDGWKAERIDEYEIRVVSAEGEAWRLRSADKNDMFNNFIFRWAEAMLSAAPAQQSVKFLADSTRFKITLTHHVCKITGLPRELGGKWVALVDADNDSHLMLTTPPTAPARKTLFFS